MITKKAQLAGSQRILIVDNNIEDRQSLRNALRNESARLAEVEADVVEVETLAQARALLTYEECSCIFVSETLPDGAGISLLAEVRGQGLVAPVVVLTGRFEDPAALESIQADAIDLLPRGYFSPEKIARSVQVALRLRQIELEKKAASEILRIRERAIDAATNGILISDASLPGCPIVYANPAFLALSGYSEAEILGRNCSFLQGPETNRETVDQIRQAIKSDYPIQVMIQNYHKNGTAFWNEVTITPVWDTEGKATHYIGVQTDITQRITDERAQKDLITAMLLGQEQFMAVQNGMADGLIVADKDGLVLTMNPVALRLLGFESLDQVQRQLSDFEKIFVLHSLDGEVIPLEGWPLSRVMRGEHFSDFEARLTRIDTGHSWIGSFSGASVQEGENSPYRGILSLRDVSGRRAAEESVRRFQHLSDNANDEFYLMNSAGQIVYVNAAACAALGYTQEQLQSLHITAINPLYQKKEWPELFDRAGREVIPPYETVHQRKNGTIYPVEASLSRLSFGTEHLLFASARDITERKATEAKMVEMYEREHRIAEALQRSMLSTPPESILGGLEVETVYQPAWKEAQVGGDYYDVFAVDGGRIALVVADVSGKGLEAASRTAEIKFTLRAYLREYPHGASALTRLNSFLCEAQMLEADPQDYFVVLTLILIDPQTGIMEITLAGAELPLVLRADGTLEEVGEGGMLLGISPKQEYALSTGRLEVGDILLAATDGITEARQGRNLLGNDGMARMAQEARSLETLAEMGQAIFSSAQEYAGGKLHDDACLLLARRG